MARTVKPKLVDSFIPASEEVVVVIEGQSLSATPVGGPVEFAPGMDVWERHHEETDKEWAYFQYYRDLPAFDRTIKATYLHFFPEPAIAACTGRPVYHSVNDIALRFRWRERVQEYDRFQDEIFRNALLIERVKARRETAVLGSDMRRKAARALSHIQATLAYEVIDPDTGETHTETKAVLTVKEVIDLAKTGSALEMTALDMQKEIIVAQQVHINIKDEEGELLQAAKELIKARDMIDITPSSVSP